MSGAERMRPMADETIVWQGRPSSRTIARDVFHLRAVCGYLALLVALDAYQAWAKAIPLAQALHASVPLAVIIAGVLANFGGLAILTARATRYTITTRRVILEYGVAIPATLSIPLSRVARIQLSLRADHAGDIALKLEAGERMPYLKLWPYARPWHVFHPQPMLRGIPQAAVVAGLLTRSAETSAKERRARQLPFAA